MWFPQEAVSNMELKIETKLRELHNSRYDR